MVLYRGRDSSVGIETGYRLNSRGSFPGRVNRFFSAPQRPDQLLVPPSLLANAYRGLSGQGVNLTAHLCLVPRARTVRLYLHSPTRLHSVVLNYSSTETVLPLLLLRSMKCALLIAAHNDILKCFKKPPIQKAEVWTQKQLICMNIQENIEYVLVLSPRKKLHMKEKLFVPALYNSKLETQRTESLNSHPTLDTKFRCQKKYLEK
jgi:hypothetical protein